MPAGTISSINVSRLSAPMASSMNCSSACERPICRPANSGLSSVGDDLLHAGGRDSDERVFGETVPEDMEGSFPDCADALVRFVATDVVFYPPEETEWREPLWEPCCPWT